jgi:hypothetical protein
MFHVEVRQFPHVARAFNLSREQIDTRIIGPWASNTPIELDDRRWAPERARLTVYEGRELRSDELGLGRGWANVTRTAEDVTARLLAETEPGVAPQASVEAFKRETVRMCAAAPMSLGRIVAQAGESHPELRVSELVALVEQAVWELLHERRLQMRRAGASVDKADWRSVLFSWSQWAGADADPAVLERPA